MTYPINNIHILTSDVNINFQDLMGSNLPVILSCCADITWYNQNEDYN